jgi:hypothetical protein
MNTPHKWSINISIYPARWLEVRVWVGNRFWGWYLRRPLKVMVGKYCGDEPKRVEVTVYPTNEISQEAIDSMIKAIRARGTDLH